jgi:hypothetical protein
MPLNPYASMRFSSVFDKTDPEDPLNRKRFFSGIFPLSNQQPPEPPPEQDEGGKYFDEIERIRTNRGPALTAYQEHLDTMPTREETKPSKWRRLGASLSGAAEGLQRGFGAGFEHARGIVDAPYEKALGEWGNKQKSLGASAALEREEVQDQLKALSEARALGLKYDEYKLKRLESERDYDIADRTAATRERIADLTAQRDAATDARERRRIDAEITRAKEQLEINRFTATTGRQNANTQAANVESMIEDRTEGRVIDRERIAASVANSIRRADGSKPNPNEQYFALQNALDLLKTDPKYGRFVETDKAGKPSIKPSDGSPDYQEFMRRLKITSERSLSQGSFLDTDFGDEEEDDVLIEPEPR